MNNNENEASSSGNTKNERNRIQRAKEELVKSIRKGSFGNYSTVTLGSENIVKIIHNNNNEEEEDEKVLCVSMKVLPHMTNSLNNLHGGAMATLVDLWTSAVLYLVDPSFISVSINLSMDYISSAPLYSNILITSKVLYAGKSIQFSNCSIHCILPNNHNNTNHDTLPTTITTNKLQLVAKGTHIKKKISSSLQAKNHRSKL